MVTAVVQAITFCQRLFLKAPMSRGLLTSSSMYTSTKGSRMPLAICE